MLPMQHSGEVWSYCQKTLPIEYRRDFDSETSFCLQERALRESLLKKGRRDLWLRWKNEARPVILNSRIHQYASEAYEQQRREEYARRDLDWNHTLTSLITSENFFPGQVLIDVGSNEGTEAASLPFRVHCVEPSKSLCRSGKTKFPVLSFLTASADSLPFKEGSVDVYLSLRTWCVAGVLADEALFEARRVLKRNGGIFVSFPLRFEKRTDNLKDAIKDKVRSVAEWAYGLMENEILELKCFSAPEDFFIYGRVK